MDRNGFVCVPMLEPAEVAHLLDIYQSLPNHKVPEYGFHVSLDNDSNAYKEKAVGEIRKLLTAKAEKYFDQFRIFTASYVVKEQNPKGVVPPHQDWTFVDESQFNSLTVWTALVDTDMDNGCMGVINGSHQFFDYLRASPSPQCKTPISDHMFTLFPYLQLKPMKAGEALIFDNRTIHASPPNTTENARIAVGIGITQAEAQLYHHYLLPNQDQKKVARYAVEDDFFLQYNNGMLSDMYNDGKQPAGLQGELLDRNLPEFSAEDILAMIKQHPENLMNVPLVEKMAQLFNYNLDGTPKSAPAPTPSPPARGLRGWIKRLFG